MTDGSQGKPKNKLREEKSENYKGNIQYKGMDKSPVSKFLIQGNGKKKEHSADAALRVVNVRD